MMRLFLFISIILFALPSFAQNERKFIRRGNDYFEAAIKDTTRLDTATFNKAETQYRKALEKKPGKNEWEFNLADALYKQKRFKDAEEKFIKLHEAVAAPEESARALHNLGNSQLMQQKIDESIKSYKKALRKNPDDLETKYNLAYAQMLKKQQQNKEQQNKEQQNKQQQNKEQQNKEQQNNQQQNNQQQNKEQQNNQQQNNQQQNNQQQNNKISRQDAEQLLQALQNDERDIQEKVKKAKAAKARKANVEKEW